MKTRIKGFTKVSTKTAILFEIISMGEERSYGNQMILVITRKILQSPTFLNFTRKSLRVKEATNYQNCQNLSVNGETRNFNRSFLERNFMNIATSMQ